MADEQKKNVDDVFGAESFLRNIDEQDNKMICANEQKEVNEMLFTAALSGKRYMVEVLVKKCQANMEEVGKFNTFHSVTPLWCAAGNGELEVVKILRELGANINAVSNTGTTAVNHACIEKQIETVKYLVEQGADINRADEGGYTCLMNSIDCLELCQFLIHNGARVNEQDNVGNTALHHAIKKEAYCNWALMSLVRHLSPPYLKIVQLLLDHGSDQNIKNNLGDDALQFASLRGLELIVKELEVRQKPSTSRWIESLQLLGSNFVYSNAAIDTERTLVFWRKSVETQMLNPCAELCKTESTPLAKKVNTVEELEELCQDEEMVYMYALEILLRIIGPCRSETTMPLVKVSQVFAKHKRHFDLLKYALHRLLQDCCDTPTWKGVYLTVFSSLDISCYNEFRKIQFQLEFHDVFEILDMVTSKAQFVSSLNCITIDISCFMQQILSYICFLVKLDKSPDQLISFQQVVHRLVHSQIRDAGGMTFLHHAAEKSSTYPGVAKVLLECGADVNSVDSKHNTALHICTGSGTGYYIPISFRQRNEVSKLLLEYSAHPDIVNDHGDLAATGMSLNMLDHVSLKCLATAVIRDLQIPYVGQIPKSLESFVQMHGRCPSRNFQYRSLSARQIENEVFLPQTFGIIPSNEVLRELLRSSRWF